MIDADPGGTYFLVLQSFSGVFVSLLFTVFFALLYVFISTYSAIIPRLDEEMLEEQLEKGQPKIKEILVLRRERRSFLHHSSVLKYFSLIFLTWTYNLSIFTLLRLLLPLHLSFLVWFFTILSLCLLLFVLMSVATEYPARLQRRQGLRFALRGYPLYHIFDLLLSPISVLSRRICDRLLRQKSIDPEENSILLSEQELKELLERNAEQKETSYGVILDNVFAFADRTVAECMTHRVDMVAVDAESSLADLMTILQEEKYSRIPVYEEDIDHIIGIVHSRDVLLYVAAYPQAPFRVSDFLRETSYTPETQSIAALFTTMQRQKQHIAIVIDEYGGTAGLITMEDVLEELVGQIEDEYDDIEVDFLELSADSWMINAWLSLKDLNEYLNADFPEEDYDTVAGFVLDLLDRIPQENEKAEVRYADYVFRVEKMDDKRLEKLFIKLNPLPPASGENEETED